MRSASSIVLDLTDGLGDMGMLGQKIEKGGRHIMICAIWICPTYIVEDWCNTKLSCCIPLVAW
jgi:hypothetical protein